MSKQEFVEKLMEMRSQEHQSNLPPRLSPSKHNCEPRTHPRLAVLLAFLVAGFGMACWAPLVPLARDRLMIGESVLGTLLLCLGLGSVSSMLAAGALSTRYGTKALIVGGGLGMAAIVPFLALASTPLTLGMALGGFGACLGSLDVAMNINALDVERRAQRPLMSGFHALYSVGGFAGSAFMTALLSSNAVPWAATLIAAALMCGALLVTVRHLSETTRSEHGPLFAFPRKIVLLIAALAGVTFLVEGAMLDWSALLVVDTGLMDVRHAGTCFMLFSVAMTLGRLFGDRAVARLGDQLTLQLGGALSIVGFVVLLLTSVPALALCGFMLIGLGISNVVPVLFRRAGQQQVMPAALAVSAVTTAGYAGVLLGPAMIGFAASWVGLSSAFWLLAILVLLLPVTARLVVRKAAG
ncbi:MFS transporter [Variovorax sp. tm]|uniref:MFS transporter n=1 Tax=Variovorax atrisoli TaxID=3394203 RepID=UPI003A8119AD